MSVTVEALQELEETQPAEAAWCCACAFFSAASTIATCFGCTFTN
jgi:hypothetical protein